MEALSNSKKLLLGKINIMIFIMTFFPAIGESADLTPNEVMSEARRAMETLSYQITKKELIEHEGEKIEQITLRMLQKRFSDGVVCTRIETFGKYAAIELTNREGCYELFPDVKKGIKINRQPTDKKLDLLTDAEYSMKDGFFGDIPCYVITATIVPTESLIKEIRRQWMITAPKEMTLSDREIESRLNRKELFYVAKNNFFIYSHKIFDAGGKLIFINNRDNVEFNPDVEEAAFEMPGGYTIEISNGWDDYQKRSTELRKYRIEKYINKEEDYVIESNITKKTNIIHDLPNVYKWMLAVTAITTALATIYHVCKYRQTIKKNKEKE